MSGQLCVLAALFAVLLAPVVVMETCPSAGAPGHPGFPGFPGRDGRDGQKGEKGATGTPLIPGQASVKGMKGEPGLNGPQGKPGRSGESGPRGALGAPGLRGDRGNIDSTVMALQSAFSVSRLTPVKPEPNRPIVFSNVITNINNHYNVETGKFECIVDGTYYFVFHTSLLSVSLCVDIMLDGELLASFCDREESKQQVSSGGLTVYLKKNQAVWLETAHYNGMYALGGKGDSVFSGFLISAH